MFLSAKRYSPEHALPAAPASGNRLRSGHFCGATRAHRLIQKTDHARNDCGIRQVKHVPVAVDPADRDVQADEIDDRAALGEAIDGVADRPADDEAEGEAG